MRRTFLLLLSGLMVALHFARPTLAPARDDAPTELYVDAERGRDRNDGSERRPLRSISAALALLDARVEASVTIHLAAGTYDTTGGEGMPEGTLELARAMGPRVEVALVGPAEGARPVLGWRPDKAMVAVTEGRWRLARVVLGTDSTAQRRGVVVEGPAVVTLEDVALRMRSNSGEGIWARYGGRAMLRGAIELNAHRHEEGGDETFIGLLASDHGLIAFDDAKGSTLSVGDGSLQARYYGQIRLGCESARITCWTDSNCLGVNSGGRIDVRGTPLVLRAVEENNTPIGLEHDGHVLAEDAHVKIVGPNHAAIALQKESTFTCNDIELVGKFHRALWATSGSMFVGRFLGDVPGLQARTGASVHVERIGGELTGEPECDSGAVISLPDRVVRGD